MTKPQAIKTFFEAGDGRKVTLQEQKELKLAGAEGYAEIARLCAEELGVELVES